MAVGISASQDGVRRDGLEILAFQGVDFSDLIAFDASLRSVPVEAQEQIARDALYANYIERQRRDVEAMERDEAHEIPSSMDFMLLEGLSHELRQKLDAVRPTTLGQAGRIDGMTPAALTLDTRTPASATPQAPRVKSTTDIAAFESVLDVSRETIFTAEDLCGLTGKMEPKDKSCWKNNDF